MTFLHDVFYGGSRDGQTRDLDQNVTVDRLVDGVSGDVYGRMPDFDTDAQRAWFFLPTSGLTAANGVSFAPPPGEKYITLGQLRALVVQAARMGHADDAVVNARVSFKCKVTLIGIEPKTEEKDQK